MIITFLLLLCTYLRLEWKLWNFWTSLVSHGQRIHLPGDVEDPLENEMTIWEQRSLAGYSPGVTRVRHDLATKQQQQQQWIFFPEKFRILSHFLEIHWLPKARSCGVHHFQIMIIPDWAVEHEVLQLILTALGGKSCFYFSNRWRINLDEETDWLTQAHRAT